MSLPDVFLAYIQPFPNSSCSTHRPELWITSLRSSSKTSSRVSTLPKTDTSSFSTYGTVSGLHRRQLLKQEDVITAGSATTLLEGAKGMLVWWQDGLSRDWCWLQFIGAIHWGGVSAITDGHSSNGVRSSSATNRDSAFHLQNVVSASDEHEERHAPCCIKEFDRVGGPNVMVWTGISGQLGTPLIIIERNLTSSNRISSHSSRLAGMSVSYSITMSVHIVCRWRVPAKSECGSVPLGFLLARPQSHWTPLGWAWRAFVCEMSACQPADVYPSPAGIIGENSTDDHKETFKARVEGAPLLVAFEGSLLSCEHSAFVVTLCSFRFIFLYYWFMNSDLRLVIFVFYFSWNMAAVTLFIIDMFSKDVWRFPLPYRIFILS